MRQKMQDFAGVNKKYNLSTFEMVTRVERKNTYC